MTQGTALEGLQAVLFDLPARRFYIFGLTFWPRYRSSSCAWP